MIGYEDALRIAKDHFEAKGGLTLTKAFDAGEIWVFNARKDGVISYGGGSISVAKQTGEVAPFLVQAGNNFELINKAHEIEL